MSLKATRIAPGTKNSSLDLLVFFATPPWKHAENTVGTAATFRGGSLSRFPSLIHAGKFGCTTRKRKLAMGETFAARRDTMCVVCCALLTVSVQI
jgi:hypothetical protein